MIGEIAPICKIISYFAPVLQILKKDKKLPGQRQRDVLTAVAGNSQCHLSCQFPKPSFPLGTVEQSGDSYIHSGFYFKN